MPIVGATKSTASFKVRRAYPLPFEPGPLCVRASHVWFAVPLGRSDHHKKQRNATSCCCHGGEGDVCAAGKAACDLLYMQFLSCDVALPAFPQSRMLQELLRENAQELERYKKIIASTSADASGDTTEGNRGFASQSHVLFEHECAFAYDLTNCLL